MDRDPAVHRAVVVVDVEKFGDSARTHAHQLAVRAGLYAAVEQAFDEAGVAWERCGHEDRGDGILVLVPPDAPKSRLVDQLPGRLVAALRRHNARSSGPAQIRLRVAVDAGEVHLDTHGITGEVVNRAFRLLDAPPLRQALAASPGVLALITSDRFYEDTVRHEPAAAPGDYRPVRVVVKETDVRAWVCLPDGPPTGSTRRAPGLVGWTVWHLAGALALLFALGGASALVWSTRAELLDPRGVPLGVVGGWVAAAVLVAGMGAGIVAAVRTAVRLTRPVGADPGGASTGAAADLARWVERQWRRESAARALDRPEPLRVRWSSTSRPVAAAPEEVLGPAGPGVRVLRLRLAGDVHEVVEKFTRLPYRQLVVLGRPGAGKSVLMMLLTLGLLRRWSPDQPVPVLLSLTSWNPAREHLHAWLARRLVEEYPGLGNRERYGPDAAARLVGSHAVLPVLDGLDEMPRSRQAAAVAGLNDAVAGGHPIVVACRVREYEAAVTASGAALGRAAVVELEPVDAAAAAAYLPAGQAAGTRRWAPVLDRLRDDPRGSLAEALSTPLMVYLARAVYRGPARDPVHLGDRRRWRSAQQVEDHLLDAYLPALYAPGGAPPAGDQQGAPAPRDYPVERAECWLTYLARRMSALGTRDLAWWQLSQTGGRFGLLFGLAARLLAGLGFGLAFGLTYGFTHGPGRGLLYGVTYALAFGLGLSAGLRFDRPWLAAAAAGLVGAGVAGAGIGPALGPALGTQAALEVGFIAGFGIGLLARCRCRSGARPRQIELSAARLARAVVRWLPAGVGVGVFLGLVLVLASGRPDYFAAGFAYAVPFMIGFGTSEAIVMPVDHQDSVTPASLLRGERAATIAQAMAMGLAAGIADLLTTWTTSGLRPELLPQLGSSLLFGLVFGLAAGLADGVNSPWLRYVAAQGWLALRGRLPWRLMRFLDDAHRRGVLRQVGGTYQFRHVRLQDRLADLGRDGEVHRTGGRRPAPVPARPPAWRRLWADSPGGRTVVMRHP
ncbi:hypothetical protein [Actinophytocola xanthii]|uniref:NACHT domain-containing protein n=1 Tax=Actinophytocola xanthii TaxID=1912961 RepID=A0A1Q8CPU0_9PSEU|nr:hypothetical protein [Actinophytocola xanthii]OLF16372.1 hypothetical protein BU204_17515 [Actinophytocola xanthii]